MEAVSNNTTENIETFEYPLGKTMMLWNGREILIEPSGGLLHLLASVLNPKECPQLCSFRGKKPSFFDSYFDSETKKQNNFDIRVRGAQLPKVTLAYWTHNHSLKL